MQTAFSTQAEQREWDRGLSQGIFWVLSDKEVNNLLIHGGFGLLF